MRVQTSLVVLTYEVISSDHELDKGADDVGRLVNDFNVLDDDPPSSDQLALSFFFGCEFGVRFGLRRCWIKAKRGQSKVSHVGSGPTY